MSSDQGLKGAVAHMAPMRAPTHLELNMPRVLNGALDVAGAVSESSLSLSLHGKEGQGGPVS